MTTIEDALRWLVANKVKVDYKEHSLGSIVAFTMKRGDRHYGQTFSVMKEELDHITGCVAYQFVNAVLKLRAMVDNDKAD